MPSFIHLDNFFFRLDFEKEKDGEEKDENRQRILEIRGEREKVHSAEMRIRKLIAETPVLIKVEVVVPQAACGRIIGRGGQTIREISSVSGLLRQFSRETQ